MNTKLCRPILIENVRGTLGLTDNKEIVVNLRKSHPLNPYYKSYELILISLNDKKQSGDRCVCLGEVAGNLLPENKNNQVSNFTTWSDKSTCQSCKKIIATQDQLSPKYIQQFIKEYNNNNIQDIEIEMEEDIAEYVGPFDRDAKTYKPKLTNGFVNIVTNSDKILKTIDDTSNDGSDPKESHFIQFLEERINTASSIQTKSAYTIVLNEYKKLPILYTEEEVKTLLHKYDNEIGSFGRDGYYASCFPQELEDWFNNNKKK